VLRRWVRNRGRETQAEGCPECFDLPFYRWVASYRRRSRPIVLAAIDEHCRDADVHVLRSPRAVRRFLASVD
jgi:hypothetical protein